jgi:hypothetical protein
MMIDNKQQVKVTGVYEGLPFATTFRDLNFIAPWDLYVASENWVKRNKNKKIGAIIHSRYMHN